MMISNIAAGNVAIQFGLKGKSIDVVTACASGTNSIGEAFRTIQYGDADVMVAGGCEAAVSPIGISTFDSLTALTSSTDPDRCSIPFDKDRTLKTREQLNRIYADRTGQSLDKIAADMERDFYMTPDEAQAYGLIDQVIAKRG